MEIFFFQLIPLTSFLFIVKNLGGFYYLRDYFGDIFLNTKKIEYLKLTKLFLHNVFNNLNINLNFCQLDIFFSSIVKVYPGAAWLEREIHEGFGFIFFFNVTKLHHQRLLLDYGFRGKPLKKMYPTSGFFEITRDEYHGIASYRIIQSLKIPSFRVSGLKNIFF
jgi:NADH:ubiquinone oxidoreductase subunit C